MTVRLEIKLLGETFKKSCENTLVGLMILYDYST